MSFPYDRIKQLNVYPTSIIFTFESLKNQIRLNTNQSYEISQLINHYNKSGINKMVTKNFEN